MGIISITQEFSSPIARGRLFKALIIDSSTLLPKLLSQSIKSIVTIKGNGPNGVGSIEQVNFTESSHFKYMKHQIDELDEEMLVCKYRMIEGDALGDKLEFIAYDIKFEEATNGGCICRMTSEYHTLEGYELKEEEIMSGKESALGIFKVVEAYLLDNPLVYA